MKASQLIFLMVCISGVAALQCKHCVPRTIDGECTTSMQTCRRSSDVCMLVFYNSFPYTFFGKCAATWEVTYFEESPRFTIFTCSTDVCN